jgi:N-acetylated-alpha-linked acidic dipeptidase
MLGFTAESSVHERAIESRFDGVLRADDLRDWMKRLAARPHHVGSEYGRENAEFIAAQLKSWGFDTRIEEFQVLFPTPTSRLVEMTSPTRFRLKLSEPALKEDSTSGLRRDQLPTYNAYSVDGDVTAELVYVNQGVPKDYEALAERGIDVKGKIVIARYGGSWRGIKPKVAAEHGAVGCIIYSDPKDDGYFQGDLYPKGPFRNADGAQRGSVADMPLYSGDPLTPNVGATKDAKRLAIKDAQTLTKIPVLPISYSDALPLLKALGGPVAPEDWRGALPITYHIGPGPATVHMKLAFDWKLVPCRDVIATMRGSDLPDEWVIRGNHHDAWVFGADDPISGAVAVMEEARGLGELAKTGWKPRRTILYCLWDGEEPGLLGSTEWVETHSEELTSKAVAYINSDNNGRGFLRVTGSHTLESMVDQVARDVTDPEKKVSAFDRARARQLTAGTPAEKTEAKADPIMRIAAMGSGSDYSPFLQHIGVAALDIRYGGENSGGSYHSVYDSFDHYTRFGDPTFEYGIALAQTAGRVILRLANADRVPAEYSRFAATVYRYVGELTKLLADTRSETAERNRLIQDGAFSLATDPTKPFVTPKPLPPVPELDFSALLASADRLRKSAAACDSALANVPNMPADRLQAIDALMIQVDRAMILANGLPRRPWYKHALYAPGFYTGYAVKTIPGVREAIEERKWDEAREQLDIAAACLGRIADAIDKVTAATGQP